MKVLIVVGIVAAVVLLVAFALAVRIVKQDEQGVLFRLGRVRGVRKPGLRLAYFRVVDAVKSVVAIENVRAAIRPAPKTR